MRPEGTGAMEEGPTLGALEPTERLVEDDEPGLPALQRPAEPDALSFPAGNAATPLPQRRLQSLGQALEDFEQIGRVENLTHDHRGAVATVN